MSSQHYLTHAIKLRCYIVMIFRHGDYGYGLDKRRERLLREEVAVLLVIVKFCVTT